MPFLLVCFFIVQKRLGGGCLGCVGFVFVVLFFFGLDRGGVGLLDLCFFRRFND